MLAASEAFANAPAASAPGAEAELTTALAASLANSEMLEEGEASTQLPDLCVLTDLIAISDVEWVLEENNGRGECFRRCGSATGCRCRRGRAVRRRGSFKGILRRVGRNELSWRVHGQPFLSRLAR